MIQIIRHFIAAIIILIGYPVITDAKIGSPCAPITLPTTIVMGGNYCLAADLHQAELNQHAIVVAADDVHLDLRGHVISGPAGETIGDGINVTGARFTVRNGTITGFFRGVTVEGDSAYIEKMEFLRNSFRGVRAIGRHVRIAGNHISDMSGAGGDFARSHTFAIEVAGPYCYITDNRIRDIEPYAEGEAAGISVSNAVSGCEITGNIMTWESPPSKGRLLAIWAGGTSHIYSLSHNRIIGADYGFGGRPPVYAEGNEFVVRCSPWMQRAAPAGQNLVLTNGECADSIPRLLRQIQQYPDDAAWVFRAGQAIAGAAGENAAAYPFFKKSCELGHPLGCRLTTMIEKVIGDVAASQAK